MVHREKSILAQEARMQSSTQMMFPNKSNQAKVDLYKKLLYLLIWKSVVSIDFFEGHFVS